MGIHGLQMVAELNGTMCLPLEQFDAPHQTIMRGRTLGQETSELAPLQSAVATLAARAAFCLRRDTRLVRAASLLMNTNRHKPGYRQQSGTVRFATPTADTGIICGELNAALRRIHNPHLGIYRVNVLFHELVPASVLKLDLFGEVDPVSHDRSQARMAAFDTINARFGKGHIRYAAETLSQAWQPRKGLCSPRYTSAWPDIPVARLNRL
jgi:DNA polymerase V